MRIVQTVFGVFHHFDLARELYRRGHLERIYSSWPWKRIQREGIPHDKVKTFPWVHTPEFVLKRAKLLPRPVEDLTGYLNALTLDEYTTRTLPECDALIGISGSSLKAGRLLQTRGGVFFCDRGSSHQRYQEQIVSDEYRRWGVDAPVSDPRDTAREEEIYAVANGITVPSSFAARSFVEMGFAAEKIHIIPYGVRLERFKPTGEPPTDRLELLFVGNVGLRKGIPYLLEAFARLKHPNKRLRVVGAMSREMPPVLERLPKDNVEILGILPQQQVAEMMSQSHLLVLPSVEEGLALVQGQALACGCPVLATTNTGGEDLFQDGVEGFIVPIRDVDALLHRMEQIADEPAVQQRMRAAGLERVKHLGGWETYGDRWEALLQKSLSR
ncbi:MAG TPA: glycosyltransferase family 4 protein [Terriglobus sp.]